MQDNLPELLSPKEDVIFKLLFGDERYKDLTISFISAVLGYKDGELEEIHVLCLKKLSRLDNERLREWLRFINSEKREEFMELAGIDPVFVKAVDVLETFSADDYNRMLYEARLKEWRDNKSRMDGALREFASLIRQGYSVDEAEKKMGLN